MAKWQIDFLVEPVGREVSVQVEAPTSKAAMMIALADLQMGDDELLHMLHAHIGRPFEDAGH